MAGEKAVLSLHLQTRNLRPEEQLEVCVSSPEAMVAFLYLPLHHVIPQLILGAPTRERVSSVGGEFGAEGCESGNAVAPALCLQHLLHLLDHTRLVVSLERHAVVRTSHSAVSAGNEWFLGLPGRARRTFPGYLVI